MFIASQLLMKQNWIGLGTYKTIKLYQLILVNNSIDLNEYPNNKKWKLLLEKRTDSWPEESYKSIIDERRRIEKYFYILINT